MKILVAAAVVVAAAVSACSAGGAAQSARSMEQIHAEQGVPVRVRAVEARPFASSLLYNATLKGAAESKVTALISDHVARVDVKVGDSVAKDALLITFPTDNPVLGYEQARIAFETAEEAYNRLARLYQQNGVSKQDHDNAKAALDVARANWTSVQDRVRVKAPVAGTITRLNVRPADGVSVGDDLLTISNYDQLEARVWVADTEVRAIGVGQTATARWQSEQISGRVTQVDLAMDEERQAFLVVVRFDNSGRRLSSGLTAEIRIQTYFNAQSIAVQRREIVGDGAAAAAYVLENGKAVRRPLKLGREQGVEIEVLEGLRVGDQQIVEGLDLLSDGARARVVAR